MQAINFTTSQIEQAAKNAMQSCSKKAAMFLPRLH